MYVGDSYPDARFQVSDETGVLNLSSAESILVEFIGKAYQFSGDGSAVWPATADPDGLHFWNLTYEFASGDTANADVYQPFIVVTWSSEEIETFATGDRLTVLALP
jgi:hypothetical protein